MAERDQIRVWVDEEDQTIDAAMPRLAKAERSIVGTVAEVSGETIVTGLSSMLRTLGPALTEQTTTASGFEVDSLEVNVVVNGSGGIELIGKLSVGAQASMTLHLKRRKP